MRLTPLFISLKDRDVLVIGGGKVAYRKIRSLMKSGAHVRVIAPELNKALERAHTDGQIDCRERAFKKSDIQDQFLVVAATNDTKTNKLIANTATEKNILVNVADAPELCTFMLPSVLDREPLSIAVSSGGSSPILARQLLAKIATTVPANFGELATFIGKHRLALKQELPDIELRRAFWNDVIEGNISELVLSGRVQDADAACSIRSFSCTQNSRVMST